MPLARLLTLGIAVWVAAYVVPGVTTTLLGALILAVVLGVINTFLKPVVMLLMLPINVLTLGLSALLINILLVWFAASIVPGVSVAGFLAAFLFALSIAVVHALLAPLRWL
jgi:putative membrane protein